MERFMAISTGKAALRRMGNRYDCKKSNRRRNPADQDGDRPQSEPECRKRRSGFLCSHRRLGRRRAARFKSNRAFADSRGRGFMRRAFRGYRNGFFRFRFGRRARYEPERRQSSYQRFAGSRQATESGHDCART